MEHALLTLNTPPQLEETMVDWLLEHNPGGGFTSMHVYGHGSGLSAMSVSEQVMGRQKRVQFAIHSELAALQNLLVQLHRDFPAAGMHHMLTPVISAGPIAGESAQ
jgi:hypothetical protein